MDVPDPSAAVSLEELAACLRHIHLLADKPTYRALEQQTAHEGGQLPGSRLRRTRLTRSIVSDVLLGRKWPGKAFLLTFVDACGIDLEKDRRWEQAWDRLAVQYQQLAESETEKLRQENEGLRQQIIAAESDAGDALTLGRSQAWSWAWVWLRARAETQAESHAVEDLQRRYEELHHELVSAERRAKTAERSVAEARDELETMRGKLVAAEQRAQTEVTLAESDRHLAEITNRAQIGTVHLLQYDDAREIAEPFRKGNPMILDLKKAPDDEAKRLTDFAAGLTFAQHGQLDYVTAGVFLLIPGSVTVPTEVREQLISEFHPMTRFQRVAEAFRAGAKADSGSVNPRLYEVNPDDGFGRLPGVFSWRLRCVHSSLKERAGVKRGFGLRFRGTRVFAGHAELAPWLCLSPRRCRVRASWLGQGPGGARPPAGGPVRVGDGQRRGDVGQCPYPR